MTDGAQDLMTLGTVDAPYWQALAAGEVRLPRCLGCRRWIWPPQRRCAACGAYGLTWEGVDPVGTVYSWTRTWYRFVPELDPPYIVLVAEVDGTDGARVLGLLDGPDDGLAVGCRIVGAVHPPSEATRGLPTLRWSLDAR